jgi:hypothetical protein
MKKPMGLLEVVSIVGSPYGIALRMDLMGRCFEEAHKKPQRCGQEYPTFK